MCKGAVKYFRKSEAAVQLTFLGFYHKTQADIDPVDTVLQKCINERIGVMRVVVE